MAPSARSGKSRNMRPIQNCDQQHVTCACTAARILKFLNNGLHLETPLRGSVCDQRATLKYGPAAIRSLLEA